MSSASPGSRIIDDAAARWVARIDRGPLAQDEMRNLEDWLAADVRHRGAFAKANTVIAHADRTQALAPAYAATAAQRRAGLSRRRLFLGGATIAASVGAAVFLDKSALVRPVLLRTAKGEIRHLPLSDGSSVTLNTNSVLRVSYSTGQRDVDLVSGEALFDVAKDRERPFVVRAGDTRVRAVGTSFSVRLDSAGAVRVLVSEGVVEVLRGGRSRPVRAAANVLATVTPAPSDSGALTVATQTVAPHDLARGLAWRDGMLSFDGETLADAAAEFDRYSATRVVIDDSDLAQQTVTGLFSASDPRGFAKAVAAAFNGRVSQAGAEVHISR